MKAPATMQQFNEMLFANRAVFVTYEMKKIGIDGDVTPGTPAFLYFPEYAIRFEVNKNGKVIWAKAVTRHDAAESTVNMIIAAKALKNAN